MTAKGEKPELRKIEAVLNSDMRAVELQFKLLSLLLIYYELLRDTIIDRTKSFFSVNFSIDEDGHIVSNPEPKYLLWVKDKSEFRGCRDFHLSIGALSSEDDQLLDKITLERHRAAHEITEGLLDDRTDEIDYELVFAAVGLFNKIDNWWIVNLEIATDPDFAGSEADAAGAASLRAVILGHVIKNVFGFGEANPEGSQNIS